MKKGSQKASLFFVYVEKNYYLCTRYKI